MKFSKKQTGEDLKKELEKGYDIERISNRASDLYFSLRNEHLPELEDILYRLSLMDAGPEFEYSEKELRFLAEMLIYEEKDPIKLLDDKIAKGLI